MNEIERIEFLDNITSEVLCPWIWKMIWELKDIKKCFFKI